MMKTIKLNEDLVDRINELLDIYCGYKVEKTEKVAKGDALTTSYVLNDGSRILVPHLFDILSSEAKNNPKMFLYAVVKRALGGNVHICEVRALLNYVLKAAESIEDRTYIEEPNYK